MNLYLSLICQVFLKHLLCVGGDAGGARGHRVSTVKIDSRRDRRKKTLQISIKDEKSLRPRRL